MGYTLEETFKKNKERVRQEIKRKERQQRIEVILFWFIFIAITVAVFMIIFFQNKDYGQAIEHCLTQHSENYCYRNL